MHAAGEGAGAPHSHGASAFPHFHPLGRPASAESPATGWGLLIGLAPLPFKFFRAAVLRAAAEERVPRARQPRVPRDTAFALEVQGAAPGTTVSRVVAVRDYVRFCAAVAVPSRRGGRLVWAAAVSRDVLVAYALYRVTGVQQAPGWPVYAAGSKWLYWKATTAADKLWSVPAALRWLGLPAPSVGGGVGSALKKGLAARFPSHRVKHHAAAAVRDITMAWELLGDATHTARLARAALAVGLWCMLRVAELNALPLAAVTFTPYGVGNYALSFAFSDKTHGFVRRQAQFVQLPWALGAVGAVAERVRSMAAQPSAGAAAPLFPRSVLAVARGALQTASGGAVSLLGLRPGGLAQHIVLGTPGALVLKMGGWKASSTVWLSAYARLDSPTSARALADIVSRADKEDAAEDAGAAAAGL